MDQRRNVVVLGAGIGGIVAARALRRKVPSDVRVLLVDRENKYVFAPSLLWLMSGDRTPQAISRGRGRLEHKGIEFLRGEVEGLDVDLRSIRVDGRDIPFEHLVVALGAQPAPEMLPGLDAGAINIYTPDGAIQAGRALGALDGGRVAIVIAKLPYKCPAAPNEAAFIAEAMLRRRVKAEVALYTPEPFPMPTAREGAGRALAAMLADRGVGPDDDGTTRWRCPFCAGRLRSRALPKTMRGSRTAPLVDLSNGTTCCGGTVTAQAAELPHHQRFFPGTTAWRISYGRRQVVEGANSMLKGGFVNIGHKFLRVFGLTKMTLLLAFTVVGYNFDRIRSFLVMRAQEKAKAEKPKRRAKRKTGTWTDIESKRSPVGRDPPSD